jgi:hypothetical protein
MRDQLRTLRALARAALGIVLLLGVAGALAQDAAWAQTAPAKPHADADGKAKPAAAASDKAASKEPDGKATASKANDTSTNKKTAATPPHDAPSGPASPDRAGIQYDLAWIGAYNGLINGEASDRTTAAIKTFQKDHHFKDTGTLDQPERAALANVSKEKQDQVGWRMVDDKVTGAEIGLPTKQVPNTGPGKSGTRWFSTQGQIQVETFHIREPGTTLADVFERQKKEPAGRQLEVNFSKGDFFILSGMQGLKKFYVRAEFRDGEVRGMTILYDQATEGIMDPLVVVMSSAFAPFTGSGIAALSGAPQKRKVEYGSGVIVSSAGHIVSDRRLTEGCNVIEIAGRDNAELVAADEASGLALLRLYGAGDFAPATLAPEGANAGDLTLVGIADPQAQGGGNMVSTLAAHLTGDALLPAPPPGFAGAAALDKSGRLLGMVAMKDAVVASTGAAAPPANAGVVPVEKLRRFLDAQSVAPATGPAGIEAAKAAVVRVICVRK